jgi:hypothetical protein
MKNHLSYGVLLATVLSRCLSCSSFTVTKDPQPINDQPRAVSPAVLTTLPTTAQKRHNLLIRLLITYKSKFRALLGLLWLWLLTRFYTNEKRRREHGWSFDDLALLKSIKANANRLLNIRRPEKKITRLEDWKKSVSALNHMMGRRMEESETPLRSNDDSEVPAVPYP